MALTTSNTVVLGNGANVGIGTSAPATTLDVRTADGSARLTVGTTANTGGGIALGNPAHGLQRGYPTLNADNDVGLYTTAGDLYLSANGTSTGQFVLLNNGNVGIGMNPAYKLDVNGQVRATNVAITSDRRFKTNIRPIGSALAGVLALRGVRYEWNKLGVQHGGTAGAGQVGLIAQELEAVYPELVATDAQGFKSVNYAQLAPVLIEALKEQQAQLEALKAQNAALGARVATAETDNQAMKAQATATADAFEARLRRLEAAGEGQAQK